MKSSVPVAHIRQNSSGDPVEQTLTDHIINVSAITKKLARKIGLSKAGELIGLLHDLGKYSDAFQIYIGSAAGLNIIS